MSQQRRVVYVAAKGRKGRVRHRRRGCISPVTAIRIEAIPTDSVWVLFDECETCVRHNAPYELVEP